MKKRDSEVRVSIFNNNWDLISQVCGDYVSFNGNDMFIWRDGTICSIYHLNKVKSWHIADKGFDFNRGIWFELIFIDI